jgi:Recombination endonuclease VII
MICSKCNRELPLSEFYRNDKHYVNGISGRCITCIQDYTFFRHWGITYAELEIKYGNKCNICYQPETSKHNRTKRPRIKLCVDHDHSCCDYGCRNCIRGLLCSNCNRKLAVIDDDEWVEWAREYLHDYKSAKQTKIS